MSDLGKNEIHTLHSLLARISSIRLIVYKYMFIFLLTPPPLTLDIRFPPVLITAQYFQAQTNPSKNIQRTILLFDIRFLFF